MRNKLALEGIAHLAIEKLRKKQTKSVKLFPRNDWNNTQSFPEATRIFAMSCGANKTDNVLSTFLLIYLSSLKVSTTSTCPTFSSWLVRKECVRFQLPPPPHPPTSFCSCCVYEKQTKTCGSWRRRLFLPVKSFNPVFFFYFTPSGSENRIANGSSVCWWAQGRSKTSRL